MADSAISVSTARGEIKIATDLVVDPVFGPVHLFRTVGAAAAAGLTNSELRATPVPVSGPLTDAQLRATRVPVELPAGGGGLTDTELRATPVPVSHGGLTDAQLRALAVAVSGTFWQATQPVSGTFWQATQPVSGPLTDAQLRATSVKTYESLIGKVNVALYAEAIAGIIAETAITIQKSLGFAAPAGATSNSASAGKTLRLLGLIASWISTSTTANTCRIRLRVNPAAAAVIGSPIAFSARLGWESATFIANQAVTVPVTFSEPIDIPNPGGVMATLACVAANGTLDLQLFGYEYTP